MSIAAFELDTPEIVLDEMRAWSETVDRTPDQDSHEALFLSSLGQRARVVDLRRTSDVDHRRA